MLKGKNRKENKIRRNYIVTVNLIMESFILYQLILNSNLEKTFIFWEPETWMAFV